MTLDGIIRHISGHPFRYLVVLALHGILVLQLLVVLRVPIDGQVVFLVISREIYLVPQTEFLGHPFGLLPLRHALTRLLIGRA